MTKAPLLRRIALALAAPVLAAVFALLISSIVLALSGSSWIDTYREMLENGSRLETMIDMLNRATPLYIAAVAVAIGFKMNLFNIGVEGQYILASFAAAVVGAQVALPGPLHVGLILLTAVVVGAAWAGLAGLLKVTRGVNEVISTIMLNFIAIGGIIAATLPYTIDDPTSPNQGTPVIAESGWLPNLNSLVEIFTRDILRGRTLSGMFAVAILLGVVYHVVVNRTRFGFDLRSSGMNPFAARAGGVPPKRMIMISMLASGAVAGMIGMPEILSDNHSYDQGFVQGLGFAGIAVALLGRNSAPGMAAAALLFGFLDTSSAPLQVSGTASPEIVIIMQATILLTAVIAYEVVNRIRREDEVRRAAQATRRGVHPTRVHKGDGMSATVQHTTGSRIDSFAALPAWLRWAAMAAIAVAVLTIVQDLSGTELLTSSQASGSMLRWSMPILLAGLGGLFSERVGVVNIGLEGMMILGTWCGALGAFEFGPWGGLVFGLLGGAAGGLLHAVATVQFGVDQIISGVAINILAPGLARFLANRFFPQRGGSISQSPRVDSLSDFTVPFLAGGNIGGWETPDVLGAIDDLDLAFISDLASILRGLMTEVNLFTIIGLALVPISAFVLLRTRLGLRLRICGENPKAGESLGVNIYGHKYLGVIISGALAGLAGAFIVIELTGIYRGARRTVEDSLRWPP